MHKISDNDLPQDLRAFNPSFPITIHEELLEVLDVFAQEMTSHNLTYFIAGGTLIGSWRHHGFIPWDDDADVYMHVEDRPKLKVNFQTNEFVLSQITPFIKNVVKESLCQRTIFTLEGNQLL